MHNSCSIDYSCTCDNLSKTNPPPTGTDIDSGAAVSGARGARWGITHTYRLTGAAQDAVSEEAATLVGYRVGPPTEAEVGRRRKKTIDWGMKKNKIHEDMILSAHSAAMT